MKDFDILILDDDRSLLLLLKHLLTKWGLNFKAVSSVAQFAELLKEHTPKICILDLNHDKNIGEGVFLIKAIRNKISQEVSIIATSSDSSSQDIANSLEAGANEFIAKPINKDHLKQTIENLLNQDLREDSIKSDYNEETSLDLSINLVELNEFELTFESTSLIKKGTEVKLSSTALSTYIGQESLKSTVHNNGKKENSDKYYFTIEIADLDKSIREHVRLWLAKFTF